MAESLPVTLSDQVTKFKGNGRRLGYPTANIRVATSLGDGVYFGYADLAVYKHQPSIIFIGTPTTLGDTERRVEAYLLDIPDEEYYGQRLELEILTFHRPNKHFPSIEELVKVMHQDEKVARQWFEKRSQAL